MAQMACTVMPAFRPPRPSPPPPPPQLLTGSALLCCVQERNPNKSLPKPCRSDGPHHAHPVLVLAQPPALVSCADRPGPVAALFKRAGGSSGSRPRVGPPHRRNTNEPNRHHTAGCPGSIRKCRRTRSEWTLTHGPGPDRAMHGTRPCGSQQPRLTVSRLEVRGARRAYEENREKSGKKRKNHQCVAQAQKALANDDAGMRGASCVVRLSHLSPALRLGRFLTRERSSSSDAFAPPLSSRIAVPCDLHGAAAARSSGSRFGPADPLSLSLSPPRADSMPHRSFSRR
ncbi:hypothetical protein L1887_56990 [Cichorium endivia]|nr:hypothetical protein L1887_56990 [Cichorium endivia]